MAHTIIAPVYTKASSSQQIPPTLFSSFTQPDAPPVIELIRQTRELTSHPFAMGFVLHFPYKENLQTALSEGLSVVQVYWGEFDTNSVAFVHSFGAKVIHQVESHCRLLPHMPDGELRQKIPSLWPSCYAKSKLFGPFAFFFFFADVGWVQLTKQQSRKLQPPLHSTFIYLLTTTDPMSPQSSSVLLHVIFIPHLDIHSPTDQPNRTFIYQLTDQPTHHPTDQPSYTFTGRHHRRCESCISCWCGHHPSTRNGRWGPHHGEGKLITCRPTP